MTTTGAKLHDPSGRSTGKRKKNARTRIGGQFAPRLIELLESPANRALNLSERRALSRIEIELAHHGGADNGRLPVTFDDFNMYGINRNSIAPALRTLATLGFIEVTEIGRSGNGEWRRPNLFRLTFHSVRAQAPSNDWRKIETLDDAERIAKLARKNKKPVMVADRSQYRKPYQKPQVHGTGFDTTRHSTETAPLSRYRGGLATQATTAKANRSSADTVSTQISMSFDQ